MIQFWVVFRLEGTLLKRPKMAATLPAPNDVIECEDGTVLRVQWRNMVETPVLFCAVASDEICELLNQMREAE